MNANGTVLSPSIPHRLQTTASESAVDNGSGLTEMPPINAQRLLENCMGKPMFAISLLEEFAETASSRLAEFELPSNQDNIHTLCESAHSLKGVAGILAAAKLHETSLNLEMACRNSEPNLESVLRPLCIELQRVKHEIPRLCALLVNGSEIA